MSHGSGVVGPVGVQAGLGAERQRVESATEPRPTGAAHRGRVERVTPSRPPVARWRRTAPAGVGPRALRGWVGQVRALVADVVHVGADRPQDGEGGRRGHEQLPEGLEVVVLGIEPGLPGRRRQDHRHPVVDAGHLLVGGGGDDRRRAQRLGLVRPRRPHPRRRGSPDLPQPGEGERLVVGAVDEVRLLVLLAGEPLPLVEPVGRDEAPALGERPLEGAAGGDGLGPGVDHPVADLRVLGPEGHEAPVPGGHPPHAAVLQDHVHVARSARRSSSARGPARAARRPRSRRRSGRVARPTRSVRTWDRTLLVGFAPDPGRDPAPAGAQMG